MLLVCFLSSVARAIKISHSALQASCPIATGFPVSSPDEFTGCGYSQGIVTAFKITGTAGTLNLTRCEFTNFIISGDGVISIDSSQSAVRFELHSCKFGQCVSTDSMGGAAVYLNKGSSNQGSLTVDIEGTEFLECHATYGGAVMVYKNDPSITFTRGSFSSCSSTTGGGGCYFYTGVVTVKNVEVENCISEGPGGLFYLVQPTSELTMENCQVSKCSSTNTAELGGGAIYGKQCSMYFTSCTLTECITAANGGGICVGVSSSTQIVELTNCIGIGCLASFAGGFLYNKRTSGTITIKGLECSTCSAGDTTSGQAVHIFSTLQLQYSDLCIVDCTAVGATAFYSSSNQPQESDLTVGCPAPTQPPVATASRCFTYAFGYAQRPTLVQISIFVWGVFLNYLDTVQAGVVIILGIAIGFITLKWGFLPKSSVPAINKFLLKCCYMPLIARALWKQDIYNLSFYPFLVAILSTISVLVLLTVIFGMKFNDNFQIYLSMFLPICFVNYLIIGMPIFHALWGEEESAMVAVQDLSGTLFAVPVYSVLVSIWKIQVANRDVNGEKQSFSVKILLKIGKDIITNLFIIGDVIGFAWSLARLGVCPFLEDLSKYLADTVLALCLFTVGGFLSERSLMACNFWHFLATIVMRLIVYPVLIGLFCTAFGLSARLSRQCMLMSCMPCATASFLLSSANDTGPDVSSTMILWTTVFSVPMLLLWTVVLDWLRIFVE